MIATTVAGTSIYLCEYPPNWGDSPVEGRFSALSKIVASRTNREEREAMAAELRAELNYNAQLTSSEAASLRTMLSTFDNRPIVVPFWPSVQLASDARVPGVTGGLKVWFEPDFSLYEVGTGTAPVSFTPSGTCLVAPALWGRFSELPTLTVINGLGDCFGSFQFTENGDPSYALRPSAAMLTTVVVNGLTVPKLTVPFAWGDNTYTGDIRIKRATVGYGRAEAEDFLPQLARAKQVMRFAAMDASDVSYLLSLFKDRSGSVRSWECAAPHDATAFNLGRFNTDSLTIRWSNPAPFECAECSVEFLTLPSEAATISGETPGVNIGGTPDRWFGYVVTDGTQTWRYTSFESPIAGPGGTFTPAKINHGTITEEINLALNDCTLTVQNWSGSPFTRIRNNPAAPRLTVAVYEGVRSNPAVATVIYTGEAQAPSTDGSMWSIKLKGPGAILDIKGPRRVLQETCVACLGDAKCKLSLASLTSSMTLSGISGDVATFGSAAGLADHVFAAGSAERSIGGVTQYYLIVDSYADGSGNLACVLAGTVTPAATAGETWALVQGCDGTKARCKALGNFVNFQGHPNLPKVDPAMVSVPSDGGKK